MAQIFMPTMTHLSVSVDAFGVVNELLEERQQSLVLGIQSVKQSAINVGDFGLAELLLLLGDIVADLFE
jgi:hypothetical protein